MNKKISSLKKPTLSPDAERARAFAEGRSEPAPASAEAAHSAGTARLAPAAKSGLVPAGDVRLTANIRSDLHLKLKIRAAEGRTTVGDLIEEWVESW
ncbi:MAG: hypothetical protein ABI702_06075 [Burkholderiales bacterium]